MVALRISPTHGTGILIGAPVRFPQNRGNGEESAQSNYPPVAKPEILSVQQIGHFVF